MNEEIKSAYETWLAQPNMPADLADELNRIAGNEDAITDRFYRELEFGTCGLRGVIGAGTNRMNIYNIRKATQGLANHLNASGLPKKVAIGYDSRIKSDVFARETAAVLAANGIKAYIYPRLEPTPALSWAVRYYGCGAGVCVPASHNPAKYNGYKVYGADGCQITLEVAAKILAAIEAVDCFAVQPTDFDAALAEGRIEYSSEKCLDDFVDAVNATLLVCEAAAWYAKQGMTLLDAINRLYAEFGCYRNALHSFAFEGESGMHTMQAIMKQLREAPPQSIGGLAVESVLDYDTEGTGLPKANVLEFRLAGGAKLMVRPSGTEPKIKVYLSAVAPTEEAADAINETLGKAAADLLKA